MFNTLVNDVGECIDNNTLPRVAEAPDPQYEPREGETFSEKLNRLYQVRNDRKRGRIYEDGRDQQEGEGTVDDNKNIDL